MLRGKPDFVLARRIGSAGSAGASDRGTGNRSLASTDERSQQGSSTGSSSDIGEIPIAKASAFYEETGGLQRHGFSVQGNGRQCKSQISGFMKMSRLACG